MPVTGSVSAASLNASAATAAVVKTMGKEAFLQLLVTQMRHQDPLNPMNDADFVAQLAQFSSLEQMTNMSASFERVGKSTQFTQAVSLIGKSVDYLNSKGEIVTARVDGILWEDGVATLCVGDGAVSLDKVIKVHAMTPES